LENKKQKKKAKRKKMGVAQQSRRAVAKPTQQLYTVHTSRPDIYDPTVPYNNHLISILLNQTIT
jgi:hypothetical protein